MSLDQFQHNMYKFSLDFWYLVVCYSCLQPIEVQILFTPVDLMYWSWGFFVYMYVHDTSAVYATR